MRRFLPLALSVIAACVLVSNAHAIPGDTTPVDDYADICSDAQTIPVDAEASCTDFTDLTAVPASPIEKRAAGAQNSVNPMQTLPLQPIQYMTADAALDSYARVINGDIPIFDGPAGNPIGSTGDGFVFYTTAGSQEAAGEMWTQINYGQWVRQNDLRWQEPTQFRGVYIDSLPEREFAWVLQPHQPLLTPDGVPNKYAPFLERYAMVTIYATEYVGEWRYYKIGPDQWIRETWIGKVTFNKPPEGVSGRWIEIDLYEQTMVAYEDETPFFATLVASGLAQWSTEEGLFQVYYKVKNAPMSGAEGEPDFYMLENVPYSLYFDEGKAVHGAYWHDGFGYRRSHGCVNIAPADAMALYEIFQEGDWVHVYHSAEYK